MAPGVAMGAAGVDVALETADTAPMSDDLGLPYLVAVGRRTQATILQNVAFSLLVKAAVISLVFPGWLTLWLAVAGDMGSSLLVGLNGMRLLTGNGAKATGEATHREAACHGDDCPGHGADEA